VAVARLKREAKLFYFNQPNSKRKQNRPYGRKEQTHWGLKNRSKGPPGFLANWRKPPRTWLGNHL